jgi:DNA-binding NtrC family response regulator
LSMNQKASVVIVDDEEMVITSVRAYLELETEFEIHGFTEPEQAVKHMESHLVDIAVSDYLMPRMSGIQSINEVGLYQYVEKPWENAQLLLIIQNGIERSKLLRELREKVSELDTAHSSLKNVQKRLLQAFL